MAPERIRRSTNECEEAGSDGNGSVASRPQWLRSGQHAHTACVAHPGDPGYGIHSQRAVCTILCGGEQGVLRGGGPRNRVRLRDGDRSTQSSGHRCAAIRRRQRRSGDPRPQPGSTRRLRDDVLPEVPSGYRLPGGRTFGGALRSDRTLGRHPWLVGRKLHRLVGSSPLVRDRRSRDTAGVRRLYAGGQSDRGAG